ncbi:MAG: glutamyl-tRNA reductase [Candidatus Solibacter sp.]|nr:glutamyl-tRNA reductase [Candidatus Solibacter sp.]
MKVSLIGLSHHTAPVEVRERVAIQESGLGEALEAFKRASGAEETLILSTCNRVELTAALPEGADAGAMARFLAEVRGLSPEWLEPFLYRYEDEKAIRHLFRVAASLDSMVLGEPQVLGQLKAAYAAAREQGTLGGFLDTVLTRAFAVAKRVRSETDIGRSAVSVSYAAVELAKQIFGHLSEKKVLLVGAGKMSELAARHLQRAGCEKVFVTNRTRGRADDLAEQISATVLDYEAYLSRLHEMDIVLTSSGASGHLLTRDQMAKVLDRRRHRPVFLIDIAVPRNIDPKVNELEGAFLYDIDDLGRAVDENRKARAREAEQAEEMIEAEVGRLLERLRAREVGPLISGLHEQLDQMARAELERFKSKLGPLSPAQEEALTSYTRSLLNKIAHGPVVELRRAAGRPDGDAEISLIRRIFRMEGGGRG